LPKKVFESVMHSGVGPLLRFGCAFILLFWILSLPSFAAGPANSQSSPQKPSFPVDPASYHDDNATSVPAKLLGRIQQEPLNLIATVIFAFAIVHTFLASHFHKLAVRLDHQLKELEQRNAEAPSGLAENDHDRLVFRAQLYHFMGEVEAVFGIWLIPLFTAIIIFKGWAAMVDYVGHANVNDAIFVVVIMAMAGSLPILRLAENAISRVARLGRSSAPAWWLAILTIGPILGSFITEPAAMTICALLLRRRLYNLQPSNRLKYATLGLLFVNVSVGGTMSHFAAPPVVFAASAWHWDTLFMMTTFGWKAVLAIVISNLLYLFLLRKDFRALTLPIPEDPEGQPRHAIPWWITLIHLLFLTWTVLNAHYPVLVVLGFLFFLAYVSATRRNQQPIALRPALLVGFFLASLVIHGGCQSWWIGPVLNSLSQIPLMICAMVLTAFNDNAAIAYLATLVPGFSDASKYAVMAGAIAGGGLTVIANAPNPAGQSILASRFGPSGISPLGLFLAALTPTLIVAVAFMVLLGVLK
jgi:hypothetical protein